MISLGLVDGSGACVLVDDALFDELSKEAWSLYANGYCARKDPSTLAVLYLHREVMRLSGVDVVGDRVDHINQDKLDNRLSNLRLASQSQNMCNRGKTSANTSGYKGVFFHPQTGKWRACVKKDYKQYYLGLFQDKKDAARAYNKAAVNLHGEFASLNAI